MNPLFEKTWQMEETSIEELSSIFSPDFSVSVSEFVTANLTFLDDFDSHLWRAGYLFYKADSQAFRLIGPTGDISEIIASNGSRFWWEFSGGCNTLQKLLGLRAAMPVLNMKFSRRDYLLRNEDQKIVVKASLAKVNVGNTEVHYLTLNGLRGYRKYYNRAEKSLKSLRDKNLR